MNQKIICVVVTYNREKLLLQTVDSILRQTRELDEIIIIDNASDDGTKNSLDQAGYLSNRIIKYIELTTNTGGAGGFNAGMDIALSSDADWIWVMDDDVAPHPDCLENLLKWREHSECIHPRRIKVDGTDLEWEHYIDIFTSARTPTNNASFKNGKLIAYTNVACFEGMLVSRRIVELCGFPDKKYFIGDDDTFYGIKTSTYTNNAYVKNSVIQRLLPIAENLPPWRSYYYMRNKFYLFRDSTKFLNLNVTKFIKIRFIILRIFDLIISLKNGLNYFKMTARGFYDGVKYINEKL